ncbi:MAG: S41 family peptidase [Bacteroidales bacterium]
MKFHHLFVFISLFIGLSLQAQETDKLHFVTDPTLSPDGSTVVFTYENDLWSADVKSGKAYRLTGMEGVESHPRFSPDGKWLAFSSTKNGNADVYIMPTGGGEIKQLTWHDADDYAESWSWDNNSIYFTSDRYNQFATFKISVQGETPVKLFPNYFNTPHHLVEHPESDAVYFTESWESYRFPQRKRYKGEHNPDIKSYNPVSEVYTEHTDYEGKDFWPTIDKNGTVYFVSDEWNEEYNLYKLEGDQKTRLTSFESSIGRPQVSANGKKVVFTKDYQPYIYDVAENSSRALNISLYEENMLKTDKEFQVKGKISAFDIAPDNKKMAFVSRGRLFISDIEGEFIRELETEKTERVVEVKWRKDSKNLIYTRTDKGFTNLFTIDGKGTKEEKQLTDVEKSHRHIQMDKERNRLVFIRGSEKLMMLNLDNLNTSTLVKDEFWFRGSKPRFSPDGNYIVYTAYRNFEQDIFIYNIDEKESFNLTRSGITEQSPYWSPDGRYIYFSSDRFQVSFPRGTDESHLYRIPLFKFQKEFKSEKYEELFADSEKQDTLIPEIQFDLDLVKQRWDELHVSSGQQYQPYVFYYDKKPVVLYASTQDGDYGFWKMELPPFEKPKMKKLDDKRFGEIVRIKDDFYTLIDGNVHKIDLNNNETEKIDVTHSFSKKLQDEFEQMFYENWSILAEFFYDDEFHGVDWEAIKTKYKTYLPHVQTRENLRTLFNDMLGELNSSHLGFSSNGEEEETYYTLHSTAIGVLFNKEDPYVVEKVVSKSPLDLTKKPVHSGDRLIAVNGKKVEVDKNREKYFSFPDMPEELTLTFERKGEQFKTLVHPISSGKFNQLLYDEWVEEKQKRVDKQTDKNVAYVYMEDMGSESLEDFLIDMTTETLYRDGLILDLRYNRGGNIHDDVLQFLSQRPYLQWKARGGEMSPQPNFAPSGNPIVILVNEHSLSDAEMTAAGFKELDLGTIVGTETYRWIIFTSGKQLVDGSYTRLPTWGCYSLDGRNLEKTGVKPDIYINNNFKHRLDDEDPQLDKAIEVIMQKIKDEE